MVKHISIQQIEKLIQEELSNLDKYLLEEERPFSFWDRMYLTEEMGIADDVVDLVAELYPRIENAITSRSGKTKVITLDNVQTIHPIIQQNISIETNVFGKDTSITVFNRNFADENDFNSAYNVCGEMLFMGESARRDSPFVDKGYYLVIRIRTVSINGEPMKKSAINTLQHELSHIYDQTKMGKHYKEDLRYENSKTSLGNPSDDIRRSIATIFYFAADGECSAFENGLYGELKSMVEDSIPIDRNALFNSSTYKEIQTLQQSVDYIEKAKQNLPTNQLINKILSGWETTYMCGGLITLGKETIKKYKRAVGRVWAKICKDCQITF